MMDWTPPPAASVLAYTYSCTNAAALNHAVGVLLPQGIGGELPGAAGRRPEKRPVEVLGNASGGEVGVEVQLQVVMTGDGMFLATLLVQPDPSPASVACRSYGKRRVDFWPPPNLSSILLTLVSY